MTFQRSISDFVRSRSVGRGDLVLVIEPDNMPEVLCLRREAEAKALSEETGARVRVVRMEDPRVVVLRSLDLKLMGLQIVDEIGEASR